MKNRKRFSALLLTLVLALSLAVPAYTALDWASVNSIAAPLTTGTFSPKSNATRAHIAAAPMNYSRQQVAPTTPTEPDPTPSEGDQGALPGCARSSCSGESSI